MGGGAHDLVVEQASQPPYALGKEGRELAVACSACLRSHLAQLGSFRIESYSSRDALLPELSLHREPVLKDQTQINRVGPDLPAKSGSHSASASATVLRFPGASSSANRG